MKIKIVLFMLIASVGLYAAEGYISARMCSIHESADSGSSKIGILKQSQQVTIMNSTGEWIKIKTDAYEGYVSSRFISKEPIVVLDSIADGRKDMSNIDVRKRASTYTSSAAAIRGLSSESVRDRENVSFNDYDFQSIKWIEENFSYTTDEIIEFSLVELN